MSVVTTDAGNLMFLCKLPGACQPSELLECRISKKL